jgi:uncharacterized protein (TIGR02453 family)
VAAQGEQFQGFKREAIQFLADLAANNERSWFQPRKADYERLLKEPMESLCVTLAERFEAQGIPLKSDPRKSPFRIYRDTRFSRDKSPYKTHVAANFPWVEPGREPRRDNGAHGNGGYFNFQPGEMYLGGGMWMPDKSRLDAFRSAIRDEPDRVAAAFDDPGFRGFYPDGTHTHESLKRVPPGYPADHPMADMLRWKDVIFGRRLSDREVLSAALPDLIADGFAAALPVFRFLATLR